MPAILIVSLLLVGCAARSATTPASGALTSGTTVGQVAPSTTDERHAKALPFTGRLAEGDPTELPAMVAASLSPTSTIAFAYREQLTHDEYQVPMLISAFDPATYAGAPLGDYGVAAFASLRITRGDLLLGQYVARAYISKSYSLYSEPTHRQLDDAARDAVRTKLDAALAADTARLAAAAR